MKTYYLPRDDNGFCVWLKNLDTKIGGYAAPLGVSAAEVTGVHNDRLYFNYICDAKNQYALASQEWTAYKNALRNGPTISAMPTPPALAAAPTAVTADIVARITALIERIRNTPGYTESIG